MTNGTTNGLILLVLIAGLVAFVLTRVRRRLGMGNATGRTWVIIMSAVILAFLAIWAYLGVPDAGPVNQPRLGQPTGSRRSGISNHTALPSRVGREPQRVASWSTR